MNFGSLLDTYSAKLNELQDRLCSSIRNVTFLDHALDVSELRDENENTRSIATIVDLLDVVNDRALLLRFLKKHDFDTETAYRFLVKHLVYRVGSKLSDLTTQPVEALDENVRELVLSGLFSILYGIQDVEGRPVAMLNFGEFVADKEKMKYESLANAADIWMELFRRYLQAVSQDSDTNISAGQLTLIIDLDQFSISNLSVDILTQLYDLFNQHYPAVFARVFVLNYRWAHAGAWGILRQLLSQEARSKVTFLERWQLKQHLSHADLIVDESKILFFMNEFGVQHRFADELYDEARVIFQRMVDATARYDAEERDNQQDDGTGKVDSKFEHAKQDSAIQPDSMAEEWVEELVESQPKSFSDSIRHMGDQLTQAKDNLADRVHTTSHQIVTRVNTASHEAQKRLLRILLSLALRLAPSLDKLSTLASNMDRLARRLLIRAQTVSSKVSRESFNHLIAFTLTFATLLNKVLMIIKTRYSLLVACARQNASRASTSINEKWNATTVYANEKYIATTEYASETWAATTEYASQKWNIVAEHAVSNWNNVKSIEVDWKEAVPVVTAGAASAAIIVAVIRAIKMI